MGNAEAYTRKIMVRLAAELPGDRPVAASLQRLTDDLSPQQTWPLGRSAAATGSSLAINGAGSVLASAYQFCNPPPPNPHRSAEPRTTVNRLDHAGLHRVSAHVVGTLSPDQLTL